MKHNCDCKTEKKRGIVIVYPCKKHRIKGWVWIGLQHKPERETCSIACSDEKELSK